MQKPPLLLPWKNQWEIIAKNISPKSSFSSWINLIRWKEDAFDRYKETVRCKIELTSNPIESASICNYNLLVKSFWVQPFNLFNCISSVATDGFWCLFIAHTAQIYIMAKRTHSSISKNDTDLCIYDKDRSGSHYRWKKIRRDVIRCKSCQTKPNRNSSCYHPQLEIGVTFAGSICSHENCIFFDFVHNLI